MLSFDGVVNILNNIPFELVSVTFSYLNGIDMINFINNNINDLIDDNLIKSLNVSEDELNVWKLMKNSDKKLFEWCKILYYANVDNYLYKIRYDEYIVSHYKGPFTLPSNKENRYIRKLYIGLFLNMGENMYNSHQYSNLQSKYIIFIFNIMKKYPNKFPMWVLYDTMKVNKNDTEENYIKYAFKMREIYLSTNNWNINRLHLTNIITKFSEDKYQLLISLLKSNISFDTAYNLSNPKRKFNEILINKFKELKAELQIDDQTLVSNLRNNKVIQRIRFFKSKNISPNGISNLINLDKELLENLIANNNIYDLDFYTWNKITYIYNHYNEIYQDIFTKFTNKQQNNLRMKQLMEDGGYNELLINYIKENVNKIYEYSNRINIPPSISITVTQYFNTYIELTEFQMNTLFGYLKLNFSFESALANTYQTIEYVF